MKVRAHVPQAIWYIKLLFLGGCTPYFYTPMPPSTGFLTDSVQARIGGGLAIGDEHQAAYVNGSIRANEHTFLLGSAGLVTHPKTGTTTASGGMVEFGGGYRKAFAEDHGVFEMPLLVGVGSAMLSDHHLGSDYKASVRHFRLALQPAVCYSITYVDIGFVSRFTYLAFADPYQSGRMPSDQSQNPYFLQNITDYRSRFGWEPSLVFRGGLKNLKFELMTGLGYYAPGKGGMSNYYASLGLNYTFRFSAYDRSSD